MQDVIDAEPFLQWDMWTRICTDTYHLGWKYFNFVLGSGKKWAVYRVSSD